LGCSFNLTAARAPYYPWPREVKCSCGKSSVSLKPLSQRPILWSYVKSPAYPGYPPGTGGEWSLFVDAFQALCLAGMGERQRSLDLARRGEEQATNDTARAVGVVRARVLRMINGPQQLDEFEAQIASTLDVLLRTNGKGWLPMLLPERAGLARLRRDMDGMARDVAEARRLFAEMGTTGWDEYARSIEA
jgi:hypothetical protein